MLLQLRARRRHCPPASGRRSGLLAVLLALLGACQGRPDRAEAPLAATVSPPSAAPQTIDVPAGTCALSLAVPPAETAPDGVVVDWDAALVRVGPHVDWSALLPANPRERSLLRLSPWDHRFYPARISPTRALPARLPFLLLPRVAPDAASPYGELFDVLVEFVRPFNGASIRRWGAPTLRVETPVDTLGVAYGAACAWAVSAWNAGLLAPRLALVARGAPAEVRTTVHFEPLLAYTALTLEDGARHPLAMRVHVSPRLVPGADKYARRIYLHELGHVLGLWGHTRDRRHVMNGTVVTADFIHADEARVARWLWALPDGSDLSAYVRANPRAGEPPAMPEAAAGVRASDHADPHSPCWLDWDARWETLRVTRRGASTARGTAASRRRS